MLLNLIQRPTEIFDPANKKHRAHYAKFLKERTWSTCPVQFAVLDGDSSNNNLAFAMQRKLVEYYVGKEFKLSQVTNES